MYEFRGYDWCELAECWSLPGAEIKYPTDEQEDALAKTILDHLAGSMWNMHEQHVFEDLRRFIHVLAEHALSDNYSRVWRALLEIDHNDTLLQFVNQLLQMMWT